MKKLRPQEDKGTAMIKLHSWDPSQAVQCQHQQRVHGNQQLRAVRRIQLAIHSGSNAYIAVTG